MPNPMLLFFHAQFARIGQAVAGEHLLNESRFVLRVSYFSLWAVDVHRQDTYTILIAKIISKIGQNRFYSSYSYI